MPTTKRRQDGAEAVGDLLGAFLKIGPQSPDDVAEIERKVLDIVRDNVVSAEQSTQDYTLRCDAFLNTVVKHGGLPVRAISTVKVAAPGKAAARRRPKRDQKPIPLDRLRVNHKISIDNYRREAHLYLEGELNAFRALLADFLRAVPAGGAKAPEMRRKITAIKGVFRDLIDWSRLFSTVKNNSFPASLRRTFDLEEHPIAAIWRYSVLDEQGEFRNAYSHKDRAERVYAVRNNWALQKGLMKVGPDGYVDDTIQPGEEFDCMCRFLWLYHVSDIPDAMRTAKGNAELQRVRGVINQTIPDRDLACRPPSLLRRMLRWIGR